MFFNTKNKLVLHRCFVLFDYFSHRCGQKQQISHSFLYFDAVVFVKKQQTVCKQYTTTKKCANIKNFFSKKQTFAGSAHKSILPSTESKKANSQINGYSLFSFDNFDQLIFCRLALYFLCLNIGVIVIHRSDIFLVLYSSEVILCYLDNKGRKRKNTDKVGDHHKTVEGI